jgi:hypothetical protein
MTQRDIGKMVGKVHGTIEQDITRLLAKDGQMSIFSQILSTPNPDEPTAAKQGIIREHRHSDA